MALSARGLMVLMLVVSACGSDRAPARARSPFQPASATALLNYFRGHVSVYATETRQDAIGYAHPPRSLYLLVSMRDGLDQPLGLVDAGEDDLEGRQATLRVIEHVFMPRLYVVGSGGVHVEQRDNPGALPTFKVKVEAILIDTVDGGQVPFTGEFEVQAGGIT